MAEKPKMTIPFVHMTSINKKPTFWEDRCTDWVATEKVHGSSFQFFTNDGVNVYLASRRNVLSRNGSFLKCGLEEFHRRHFDYVHRMFHAIEAEDRWERYREVTGLIVDEDGDEGEEEVADDNADEGEESDVNKNAEQNCSTEENTPTVTCTEDSEKDDPQKITGNTKALELRIYGELYGGGGINVEIKRAVQKEIIYSDEFRFYVFGISINQKWTTITEMNDLCKDAGFPYYAIPVCEPKATLNDLIEWINSSGFLFSKSRLTDKKDNFKTNIEGVVMCPLTRKDYKLHPIKLLSDDFNDVRHAGKNKNQKPNYFTKARYHAVISKLDLHEREDADMVAEMFIADILKESGEAAVSNNKRKSWTRAVKTWLAKDGYIQAEAGATERKDKSDTGSEAVSGGAETRRNSSVEERMAAEESTLDDIGALFDS